MTNSGIGLGQSKIDSQKRKKVLFCLPSLEGGGAERVFATLLQHLDRNRFELHLALLQAKGEYLEDIPKDVCIHNLKISRVRYSLPSILKLVWKLKPNTMLSTVSPLNIGLLMTKPFLPRGTRLLIRQAATPMEQVEHPERWNWAYQRLYTKAEMILCQSDHMVNELVKHFNLPREKLVRIYNPIDLQRVWKLAQIGDNPYSGPGPAIVAAGRLRWEKGYDVLLNAMPAVLAALPTARLFILGDGPRRNELIEQSRRLGLEKAVRFLNFQQNPWRYFHHAHLFVLSSRNDALPNALLEALALGTPLVATDCPGAIREVKDCDERMVLVPPENPHALAEAIVSACRKPKIDSRYPKRTSAHLSKFELQQIVGEYSALLLD